MIDTDQQNESPVKKGHCGVSIERIRELLKLLEDVDIEAVKRLQELSESLEEKGFLVRLPEDTHKYCRDWFEEMDSYAVSHPAYERSYELFRKSETLREQLQDMIELMCKFHHALPKGLQSAWLLAEERMNAMRTLSSITYYNFGFEAGRKMAAEKIFLDIVGK